MGVVPLRSKRCVLWSHPMTATTSTSAAGDLAPEPEVTFTIDGVEVAAPKGTLVIRAADQIGIQIPRFCEHPLLKPVGACRQCLVEVSVPDREGNLRPMPKPQTSCTLEEIGRASCRERVWVEVGGGAVKTRTAQGMW